MSWCTGDQSQVVGRLADVSNQNEDFLWYYFAIVYKYNCVHFSYRQYFSICTFCFLCCLVFKKKIIYDVPPRGLVQWKLEYGKSVSMYIVFLFQSSSVLVPSLM